MKNAIALVAVAGIASAAAAQSATLSIVGAPATVDTTVTTSFTIDIVADADFGTHVAGGAVALSASGDTGATNGVSASASAWGAGFANDLGDNGAGGHNGMVFGQVIFPPVLLPAAESALPGTVVASFQISVVADSSGTITYDLADAGQSFVLEIFDGAASTQLQAGSISFGSATVNFVPAPSAMALLGLGGIAAGRRRR